MPKVDLVKNLLRQKSKYLSKTEKLILEIVLITHIYRKLIKVFTYPYEQYKRLIRSNQNQEHNMNNVNLVQEMLKDILATEEYTLPGIAIYTNTPIEVLIDILSGFNNKPSLVLSKSIFEIHIAVKRELYDEIMREIVAKYLMHHDPVHDPKFSAH